MTLTTSSAATVDVRADFMDATTSTGVITASTMKPGNQNTAISSATTTDIVSAPGANVARNVKLLYIKNKDAATSVDITLNIVNASSTVVGPKVTLAAGEWATLNDPGTWFAYAVDGSVKSSGSSINFVSSSGFAGPVTGYAADTYLAGSRILLPTASLVAGQTSFRWDFGVSKTAAGIATPTVIIRYGTAGAIGDTARVTFTFSAQTAAVDRGWVRVIAVFRTVGATAVLDCEAYLNHQLATTGLNSTTTGSQELAVSSSSFDSTPSGSYIGLSVNGGASAVWTITSVMGFATI